MLVHSFRLATWRRGPFDLAPACPVPRPRVGEERLALAGPRAATDPAEHYHLLPSLIVDHGRAPAADWTGCREAVPNAAIPLPSVARPLAPDRVSNQDANPAE